MELSPPSLGLLVAPDYFALDGTSGAPIANVLVHRAAITLAYRDVDDGGTGMGPKECSLDLVLVWFAAANGDKGEENQERDSELP